MESLLYSQGRQQYQLKDDKNWQPPDTIFLPIHKTKTSFPGSHDPEFPLLKIIFFLWPQQTHSCPSHIYSQHGCKYHFLA